MYVCTKKEDANEKHKNNYEKTIEMLQAELEDDLEYNSSDDHEEVNNN